MLVLGKLIHENHSNLDNEIDKSRVGDQIDDVSVLTNTVLDSVVEALEQRSLLCPTVGKKTLLFPSIQKGRKTGVSKIVVDGGDDTISAEERVCLLKGDVIVDAPVGHGVKLDVLCGNGVEPEENEGFHGREVGIIEFGLDKFLGVQINIDGKQIGNLIIQVVVNVREIGKEKARNISKLAVLLGSCKVVDDLSLFQAESGNKTLEILGFRLLHQSQLNQQNTETHNGGTLEPEVVRHGSNENKSPKEIQVSDVDVIHVELFGLGFCGQSHKGGCLGTFTDDCVLSPVLLLLLDVGNQLALGECIVFFGICHNRRLHDAETVVGNQRETSVGNG